MTVKMIALRTCYNHGDSKEYQKGQSFEVGTEMEAVRFERAKRAKRDDSKPIQAKAPVRRQAEAPVVETKVMKAEDEAPKTAPTSDPTTQSPLGRSPNRYQRNDMRSED